MTEPQKFSGGGTKRGSITAGFGSLSEQRFNIWGSIDVRKQRVLPASERNFSRTHPRHQSQRHPEWHPRVDTDREVAHRLSNRFKDGYTDQGGGRNVGSYSVLDVSGTWTGVRNLTVTAGVLNVFDRDPPLTVQNTTFQRGYDPRFTNPLGRTFMLYAGYKFL